MLRTSGDVSCSQLLVAVSKLEIALHCMPTSAEKGGQAGAVKGLVGGLTKVAMGNPGGLAELGKAAMSAAQYAQVLSASARP